jgi:hypothetical protein
MMNAAVLAVSIALAGVSGAPFSPIHQSPTQVFPRGESVIKAMLGGQLVTADLLTHEVAIGSPSNPPPARRTLNCTYSRYPCSLVDSLVLRVGRHPVSVPRSAFGDLSDVSEAKLAQTARGRFTLTMTGGDASESYVVKLTFDRERVIDRTVVDSEANAVAEHTVYYDLSHAFQ